MSGEAVTAEGIERHEKTPPWNGCRPSQHHDVHSEMQLGTVEFTINGATDRVCPVDLRVVRSNEEHSIKSVGTKLATYFAVVIGPGAEA